MLTSSLWAIIQRLIILTAALASTFSSFSANIYYPALNSIASDLHVSASLINVTIMTYMVIVIVFFFPAVYAPNFRTLTMISGCSEDWRQHLYALYQSRAGEGQSM